MNLGVSIMNLEQQLIQYLEEDEEMLDALRMVRALALPDGYIAAGFVRNFVWDRLHGYTLRTPLADVDVIYFNAEDRSEATDLRYERQLQSMDYKWNWSVKNQARMHLRNGHSPYASVADAMSHWPETATAVAVRLMKNQAIEVNAPFGLSDLFQLVVRRGDFFTDEAQFQRRIIRKRWQDLWPKLHILQSGSQHEAPVPIDEHHALGAGDHLQADSAMTLFLKISWKRMMEHYWPKLQQALDVLTEEQLWYRESEGQNTLGGIVQHICGHVERSTVRLQQPEVRFAAGIEDHFPTNSMSLVELKRKVAETFLMWGETMERVLSGDFKERGSEISDSSPDIHSIYHLVEHVSYHLGQIIDRTQRMCACSFQFCQNGINEQQLRRSIENP